MCKCWKLQKHKVCPHVYGVQIAPLVHNVRNVHNPYTFLERTQCSRHNRGKDGLDARYCFGFWVVYSWLSCEVSEVKITQIRKSGSRWNCIIIKEKRSGNQSQGIGSPMEEERTRYLDWIMKFHWTYHLSYVINWTRKIYIWVSFCRAGKMAV